MKYFFLTVVVSLLAFLGFPGMALANTCGPATTQGTAPVDYKDYCWLDFSGYNDTTALSASGQAFSFTLPDGSSLNMTLKTTIVTSTGSPQIITKAAPSWSGAAFGNTAFIGIPGQPILYSGSNGSTVKVTLSGITVAPPAGGTGIAKYAIIVGDGESTDGRETLSFTTNGDGWTQLAKIAGTGSNYPSVSGLGTTTVTENGGTSPVGSYVFGSFTNPTTISAQFKGSGLQGFIVGVRYASISIVSQITGQRYNTPDQFTYAVKTSGGATMASGTTTGTALNGFTAASVPTVAASYPFVLDETMAAGSTGTLANYTTSLTCTNNATVASTTVMPTNVSGSSYTIPSLQYGDAVSCVFTNAPIFSPVSGSVYNDANHNISQDGTETGTSVSGLYVKLATSVSGVCQSPATASAAVDATTGTYSLPSVAPGTYCLILDTNSTLSDVTPTLPSGWLGTQNDTGIIKLTVVSAPPQPAQNFGLYNGSKLSGTVFADTGVGSGTANTGTKDGTEPGIAGITVSASTGATLVTSTSTAGDGSYTLWIPASVSSGTVVTIKPTVPSAYLSTGGSAGTTSTAGGSYSRPIVTYTAPAAAGNTYTGVNFGLVPPNTLAPNGEQTAQPGTVVFYAHTYYAGSAGQVTFALTNVATPAGPWTQVLYRDSNCSSTLDAAELPITASLTVTAGQTVCLIVKQFVPSGIASGAENTATLSATLSYTGASPTLTSALLSVIDVTTVGEPSALTLSKRVSNITQGGAAGISVNALPGETLQYTLTALNNGSSPLSALVINDATPAYTTFFSAVCPSTLPANLTGCSLSQQPAVGAQGNVQWTFTGSLASGVQVIVTYQVKVNQ